MRFLREPFSLPNGNSCYVPIICLRMSGGGTRDLGKAADFLYFCKTTTQRPEVLSGAGSGLVGSGKCRPSYNQRRIEVRTVQRQTDKDTTAATWIWRALHLYYMASWLQRLPVRAHEVSLLHNMAGSRGLSSGPLVFVLLDPAFP